MKKLVFVAFLLMGWVGHSFSGGFALYEFGGRASALGGATVAQAYDISTIFYNPGGLSFIEGTHFYGGTTLIFPQIKFTGAQPIFSDEVHEAESQMFYPVGIYLSHKFGDRLAAGIGLTNPFGLGIKWKDDFPGRSISKNVDLKSYYISPVVSYQISPNFSIGGGADIVISDVVLQRTVSVFESTGSPGYEVGEVKLEGTSELAYGFSIGMMFRTEKLSAGLLYRHSIDNQFNDGQADFTIFDDLSVPNIAAVAQDVLVDQVGKTQIEYPNFLSIGFHYNFTQKLGAEFDVMWYKWSVFDKLALDFEDDRLDQTIPEDYKDSFELRVGVHYSMTDNLSLRAGYIYDETPQPTRSVSPLLPDATRNDFSLGLGYQFGNFFVDVGYMFVDIGKRSTVENGVGKNEYGFDGTYRNIAHLFFTSLGVKLR